MIEPQTCTSSQGAAQRVGSALGRRSNWEQLAKFCVVGASGYAVNLAVYVLLVRWAGLHYIPAAIGSFLVAVANNYTWNRVWTFRDQPGRVAYQGLRFLVVSTCALLANLVVLYLLVEARCRGDSRAGAGDRARHPSELHRQQALVLPPVRWWVCAAAFALLLAPSAGAAGSDRPFDNRRDRRGRSRGAVRRGHRPAAVDRAHCRGALSGGAEGRALARPLPAASPHRCDVRQGDTALDGSRVVGQGRRDRSRQGRGRRRPCLRGLDGPSGRLEDGEGKRRLLRRQGAERVVDLDPAERRLRPRSRRPATVAVVAHPRSARARVARAVALVVQPGGGVPERVARGTDPRVPARAHRLDRVPRSGAASPCPGRSGRSQPQPCFSAACGSASISRPHAG